MCYHGCIIEVSRYEVVMQLDTYVVHKVVTVMNAGFRRWGTPERPAWLLALIHEVYQLHHQRFLIPALIAAQEANSGLHDAWAEPTTPPADILAWFEAQVASVPSPIASMDLIRIGLVRCTLEEWEQGDTGKIVLTGERILVEWEGHRSVWERDARPQLIAAITPDHDGLYCLINGLGDVVQAALNPALRVAHDEAYLLRE